MFGRPGGRYNNLVYHLPVVKHYGNLSIVHLEMINILVARLGTKKLVLVKYDNEAVVQILTSGRTRHPFLASYARNI